MKRFAFWIFLGMIAILVFAFSCSDEKIIENACTTRATVRNLSGLPGYTFELENGTLLVAYTEWVFCGTPSMPKSANVDPLYSFEAIDGTSVLIGYTERNDVTPSCTNCKLVRITCLQKVTVRE